jgi:pimeloyl-ACP methyl ester carboxylesterase
MAAPDTIVLLHGFWVPHRSWQEWAAHYEHRGYRVLAPAYPGFEVEVEALNADPTPVQEVTIPAIVDHFASVVQALDAPPVVIGHSAGGAAAALVADGRRGDVADPVEIPMPDTPTSGFTVLLLADPDGTVVELAERRAPRSRGRRSRLTTRRPGSPRAPFGPARLGVLGGERVEVG